MMSESPQSDENSDDFEEQDERQLALDIPHGVRPASGTVVIGGIIPTDRKEETC